VLRVAEADPEERCRVHIPHALRAAHEWLQPLGGDEHPGDLAEAEGHDRQVVAAQP
jgi:hypothetical protein